MEIAGIFIYWLGHASFLIKFPIDVKNSEEIVIYIDPYNIDASKDYPKADVIFITHTHYDHFSPNDIKVISKEKTIIVGPQDIKVSKNVLKVVPLEENSVDIGNFKLKFKTVPAYNKEKQFHPKSNKWVGYIIELNNKKIYHTGDSEFIDEMKSVKADIVLVPVGGTYTMNSSEAASLVNTIKPEVAIPMHWGSVVGTKEDALKFKDLVKKEIKVFILDRF